MLRVIAANNAPLPASQETPFYLLLEEAFSSKTFEISESDSVNNVIITNMIGQPVLILNGEEAASARGL